MKGSVIKWMMCGKIPQITRKMGWNKLMKLMIVNSLIIEHWNNFYRRINRFFYPKLNGKKLTERSC